jgi:hypothetical protein
MIALAPTSYTVHVNMRYVMTKAKLSSYCTSNLLQHYNIPHFFADCISVVRMILKILSNYLSKELPLTGAV